MVTCCELYLASIGVKADCKERSKAAAVEAAAEARAALPVWKRGPAPAAEEAAPHLAPVLKNSLGWGAFMASSANVRYQLVNALEDRFMVSQCRRWASAKHLLDNLTS